MFLESLCAKTTIHIQWYASVFFNICLSFLFILPCFASIHPIFNVQDLAVGLASTLIPQYTFIHLMPPALEEPSSYSTAQSAQSAVSAKTATLKTPLAATMQHPVAAAVADAQHRTSLLKLLTALLQANAAVPGLAENVAAATLLKKECGILTKTVRDGDERSALYALQDAAGQFLRVARRFMTKEEKKK